MILAILTALGGVLWGLYRLHNSGVDLNAFNPFHWFRRRKWQQKINSKPLHLIENPMEAAAVLLVATAKLDGEITREQKNFIIRLCAQEFSISEKVSAELYATSSYMLKDVDNVVDEVRLILEPCKAAFKASHVTTLIEMLHKVAGEESPPSEAQNALIIEVRKNLDENKEANLVWK